LKLHGSLHELIEKELRHLEMSLKGTCDKVVQDYSKGLDEADKYLKRCDEYTTTSGITIAALRSCVETECLTDEDTQRNFAKWQRNLKELAKLAQDKTLIEEGKALSKRFEDIIENLKKLEEPLTAAARKARGEFWLRTLVGCGIALVGLIGAAALCFATFGIAAPAAVIAAGQAVISAHAVIVAAIACVGAIGIGVSVAVAGSEFKTMYSSVDPLKAKLEVVSKECTVISSELGSVVTALEAMGRVFFQVTDKNMEVDPSHHSVRTECTELLDELKHCEQTCTDASVAINQAKKTLKEAQKKFRESWQKREDRLYDEVNKGKCIVS